MEIIGAACLIGNLIVASLLWCVISYIYQEKIRKLQEKIFQMEERRAGQHGIDQSISMMTARTFQHSVFGLHRRNHPDADARDALLLVGVRFGELCDCQVIQETGNYNHWHEEKKQKIGDIIIGIVGYAAWNDIDWYSAVLDQWKKMHVRSNVTHDPGGIR